MSRLEHLALWGGIAAPLLYVVTVLAAGAVLPGYDPVADPISALTAAGRPSIRWIEAGFGLYNLLLAAFAGVGWSLAGRNWRPVFATLMVTAGAGLLMWPFAMDMRGVPISAHGVVHLGLAAVASISTIVAVLLSAIAWRRAGDRRMARFCALCLLVITLSGAVAGVATATGWPIAGLLERLTIGGFMLWLAVTAARFAGTSKLAPTGASH
ncbi:DUF998 domain-containing protein [Devosia sp. A16]|uniref:DUF998 domain-containing protein n=1 Tax=Devosia sp. A16 TaxID=1736675 RepID=UPI0006D7F907|nr:DUF998 domain-containing protein [Devosia sp. A16]